MSSSGNTMFANVIERNNKKMGIIMLVGLLIVVGLVLVGARRLRSQNVDKRTGEKMNLSNVGGASNMDNIVSPLRKPHQCYEDGDCPDGDTCNKEGLCVPRLLDLPTSRHELPLGRGRDKEKSV